MNKLSKKLATLFLGAVTALGIGLLGSNVDKKGVKAATATVTASFTASSLPTGWTGDGTTGSYYRLDVGKYVMNVNAFEGRNITSSSLTFTFGAGSYGGNITPTMTCAIVDTAGTVLASGTVAPSLTATGSNNQTCTIAAAALNGVEDKSQIKGVRLTHTSKTGSGTGVRLYSISVPYEYSTIPVEVTTLINMINAIGTVTLDSGAAILAAELAYADLSGENQDLVTNYATLTAARSAYDGLVAANAGAIAGAFIDKVDAIHGRVVVAADETAIAALEAEYLTLLDVSAVAAILNATDVDEKLEDIRTRVNAAILAADQAAADIVIGLINALPAPSAINADNYENYEAAAKDAETALGELTPTQYDLVTNKQKLLDVLAALLAAVPTPVEVLHSEFTSGATMPAGWTQSGGAAFATTRFRLGTGGYIRHVNLGLGDNVKKVIVTIYSVTNHASNQTGATVYGLDAGGSKIAGCSATFTPYSASVSTTSAVDTAANANPRTIELDGTGLKGIEIAVTAFTSNWVIRTVHVEVVYGSGASEILVDGVTMTPKTLSLDVGETGNLAVNVTPVNADNKNYTLTSDKPLVATVAQDGKVTAVGVGTATITVTTEDGDFEDTCVVTVSEPATVKKAISAKIFDGNDVEDFNGLAFGLTTTGNIAYKGNIAGKGAQIGSGAQSGTVTIATKVARFNPSDVDKVVLNVSLSSGSGNGTVKVMVGDTQIGETVTLTSAATKYEFTGAQAKGMKKALGQDAGQLMIVADMAESGFCIGEFALYGAADQVALAQSVALVELIDEMNSLDTCDDFDMAPLLREMYDELIQDEKDLFALQTYIADGGVEDTLMNKLVHMEYRNDLAEAEAGGSPILSVINDTNTLVIMIIAILGLSALAGYCLLEKKRLAA